VTVPWPRPVALVNARVVVPGGMASRLRFASRILAVDAAPRTGDVVVDLDGAFVLPGLINAHDHLELNHYGPLKRKDRYENASGWIEDLRPALSGDPVIRSNMSYPLAARLFIGGLKNVLAGVTTVAHHNPRYRDIGWSFPVRVVKKYGWAHSFQLERQRVGARGEPGGVVRERCLATPADAPFIVHLGEGLDACAAAELRRLEEIGCLRANTVIVHGVAIEPSGWSRVLARGASLVWCPASNAFLFGRTAPIRRFLDESLESPLHVCLGSDSRLTGSRDLLDELRAGRRLTAIAPRELLRAVTTAPASVLKLDEAGRIEVGVPADLMVVPPLEDDAAEALLETSRRDVSLVTISGRPVIASPALRPVFAARRAAARPVVVDGVERLAESRLARAIARCPIKEPGIECRS
jgi:cytosine/adenosine deaminase-related metal-dependent hydrolase